MKIKIHESQMFIRMRVYSEIVRILEKKKRNFSPENYYLRLYFACFGEELCSDSSKKLKKKV